MFHFLHRVYVTTWAVALLAGASWGFAKSGISERVADWYVVWHNKPATGSGSVIELSGSVIKVSDGTSLVVRAADGRPYSVALQGLVPLEQPKPPPGEPKPLKPPVDPAKKRLNELALSNRVEVILTWVDDHRRGVGVVYVGRTNLNATLVESGLVTLKREFIKPLPMIEQYPLVRAERLANERKLAAVKP